MKQTRPNNRRVFGTVGALSVFILLAGCQTVPEEVPEGLSQMEIFQLAQEAADAENWEITRTYYETFLQRFPEDWPNRIAARYEIAFTYYKEGNFQTAERMFQNILAIYNDPETRPLPAWPRVLSERLLVTIEEERNRPRPRMFGGEPNVEE